MYPSPSFPWWLPLVKLQNNNKTRKLIGSSTELVKYLSIYPSIYLYLYMHISI